MKKLIAALQALPTLAEVKRRRHDGVEVRDQPSGASSDNFNFDADGYVNVSIHMLEVSSGTLASQSSQACDVLDPHIVKTKGRTIKRLKGALEQPWIDEHGPSRSSHELNTHTEAHNHTQLPDEIEADFGELVHCVEALKNAHEAETS
ncbi:hypothetical protein ACLOJK_038203 [Asimina triloba]